MQGQAPIAAAVAVVPVTAPTQAPASPSHTQAQQPPAQQQQQVGGATPPSSGDAPPASDEQQQAPIIIPHNLANTKEKTPMCLINELARFNKVIIVL